MAAADSPPPPQPGVGAASIPRLLTALDLPAAGAWDDLAAEARLALAYLTPPPQQPQPQPQSLPPEALRTPEGLGAALGFARRLWACEGDPWAGRRMEAASAATANGDGAAAVAAASVYEACIHGIHAFLPLLADRLAPNSSASPSTPPVNPALAGAACGGLLAMDLHVRDDYRRLTGLWKALVQLAIALKPALLPAAPTPTTFDAGAALTRLLEYTEEGLAGIEKAVELMKAQQQQQQQHAAASARAFEQAAKLQTFFLLRIALLAAHFGPVTLLPTSTTASPLTRRLAALLIRLRGLLDPAHPVWEGLVGPSAASSCPQAVLKTRDAVAAKAESAFHKILVGAAGSASSRPTTPEEQQAAATATGAADSTAAAAAHARVGSSLLAAVAVVAAQGGRHEVGIIIGAKALLLHTLGKAVEAAEAAGGPRASVAALSLVLYREEGGHGGGLIYVMSGLAAALAAAANGEDEEGKGDERAAGLLAGAVARGVVAAGSLAAARPHLFHSCLLSPHPRVRRLWARLWRHFLAPFLCHPALQQHLLEALLDVMVHVGGEAGLTRPERVHLAAVLAEGMGAVAAWDVKAALLKRLVEQTTQATGALAAAAASSSSQQPRDAQQLAVVVALTTALRLSAGAFRPDADPSRVKALQRTLRPALDLWRQLELQPPAAPQQQQQRPRRRPLWGGLGLGWALLTWDAAVPGMALPPEPWAGLLDLAVRVVGEGVEGEREGEDEAALCLRAALGTMAIAAVARREQQQGQGQGQQKPRRWTEALGRAAAAVRGLLLSPQPQEQRRHHAARLAALSALMALTEAAGVGGGGGGGGEGDMGAVQDPLADCWAVYLQQQQPQAKDGSASVSAAAPFLAGAALAAPAAAAAALLQLQQGVGAPGIEGTRVGQALRALGAKLQGPLPNEAAGAPAAPMPHALDAFSLLRGHDALALPIMEVHYQQQQQEQPTAAAAPAADGMMEVVAIDDDQEEEMTLVLDGRRAVLLPTGAHSEPALLLLPAGVGRPVHALVGEVLSAAWQQQDALRVGVVEGWESQGPQQQGVLRVRLGMGSGVEAGPPPE